MRIFFFDFTKLFGGFAHRHGATDDLATGRLQVPNLLHRGAHVARIGFGHGLNGNRRIPAHFHFAELDLPSFAALNHETTIKNASLRVNKATSDAPGFVKGPASAVVVRVAAKNWAAPAEPEDWRRLLTAAQRFLLFCAGPLRE